MKIDFNSRFVGATQNDEYVVIDVEDTQTGEKRQIQTRFLVGCDGGRSSVRKSAGLELEGRFATDHQLAIYFRATLPNFWERGFGVHTWILKPEVRALLVSLNGKDEWRCGPIGLERDEVESKTPIEWLRLILGEAPSIEVLKTSPWGGHYAVADRYRNGSIFIAGDAAHLLWPAGGFGMNTGVGDAVNLAWKLSAVLQGWGGEKLLDSYELERRPEAVQRVEESSETRAADGFQVSPMLSSDTPQGAAIREKVAQGIRNSLRGKQWKTNMPGIDLGHVYEGSPICIYDGTAAPTCEPDTYEQSSRPGSRAPHEWLTPEKSTLDEFGQRFVLIDTGQPDIAWEAGDVPFAFRHMPSLRHSAWYTHRLTLVRPDGYVAWRGDQLRDQDHLASLLRQASGHQCR